MMQFFLKTFLSILICKGAFAQVTGSAKSGCIGDINTLRNLHVNTPNLAWSDTLATAAQSWAEHLAAQGELAHASNSERNGDGENLYQSKSIRSALCADALLAWYKEEANYNYITGSPTIEGKIIGHFTQVVWKGTKTFGVGIATKNVMSDGDVLKETYIVARFSPAGNYDGQYVANVGQRKSGAITPSLHELEASVCTNLKAAGWCGYFLDNASALQEYGGCSNAGVHQGCYKTCTGC
ncbi:Golgi-associated plant pathogenesis-related protein 1-like [Clytia hemisphaerica]|uniref:SCP domain-containing protein n=1 Tax=Clytia hemisphaerica TaxID=252671 RepID=A0A7M5X3J9_9CNID|eukprot:TCONS_00005883-protein